MISAKLKKFLDENRVKYVSIFHSLAYTAPEIAASVHVKGKLLAKAVIVKVNGETVMAVMPSTRRIDLPLLGDVLGAQDPRLASEPEFRDLFPECEVGAMPPFGNLYGLRVLCDRSLLDDEEIVFNAGSHTEAVRMRFADFERLVKPQIAAFTAAPRSA
jgi:Ala-tRNA(Pro) deacylase